MKALLTLVLALLVAACAAERGDGAGSATTQEEPTTNATEETTVYTEEPTFLDFPEPPDSTLSFEGREVKGMLGSYCWSSGNSGGCSDSFWPLIPSKRKTLIMPPDSEMAFRYGGQSPPKTLEARTYPLKKLKRTNMYRPDRTLKAHGSGVQRTIPAELPPGEYVLEVSIEVNDQDGAAYYFRIMVE